MTRLNHELNIKSNDIVYDIGCGCGSVAIHFALVTGADVRGLDINQSCIDVAILLWNEVSAEWKKRYPSATVGTCWFVVADAWAFFKQRTEQKWSREGPLGLWPQPTKVWMADLLFGSRVIEQPTVPSHGIRCSSIRRVTVL